MKKIVSLIYFIVFVTISLITFKQNEKEVLKKSDNVYALYPFYREGKKEEYIAYQHKTNYSIRQSIINVNIGLNNPFYTNTKESSRKNSIDILVNKYNYLP